METDVKKCGSAKSSQTELHDSTLPVRASWNILYLAPIWMCVTLRSIVLTPAASGGPGRDPARSATWKLPNKGGLLPGSIRSFIHEELRGHAVSACPDM